MIAFVYLPTCLCCVDMLESGPFIVRGVSLLVCIGQRYAGVPVHCQELVKLRIGCFLALYEVFHI